MDHAQQDTSKSTTTQVSGQQQQQPSSSPSPPSSSPKQQKPPEKRRRGRPPKDADISPDERKRRRLASNRLAAKRAYYRRLERSKALQQENSELEKQLEDTNLRVTAYESLLTRLGMDASTAVGNNNTITASDDVKTDSFTSINGGDGISVHDTLSVPTNVLQQTPSEMKQTSAATNQTGTARYYPGPQNVPTIPSTQRQQLDIGLLAHHGMEPTLNWQGHMLTTTTNNEHQSAQPQYTSDHNGFTGSVTMAQQQPQSYQMISQQQQSSGYQIPDQHRQHPLQSFQHSGMGLSLPTIQQQQEEHIQRLIQQQLGSNMVVTSGARSDLQST